MSAGILHHLQHAIGVISASANASSATPAVEEAEKLPDRHFTIPQATARSIVVDFDGQVTSVGRWWQQRLPRLKPGTKLLDIVHIADRIQWMTALAGFKQESDTGPVTLRLNRADHHMPQAFTDVCIDLESLVPGYVRLDMWKHQNDLQMSAETNRSEGDLLAIMSHELRTPLNAIVGFSGLLNHTVADGLSDAQKSEYVALIGDAAEHMLAMVNGILDVSKIGAGKYEIHPEPFDFKRTVEEAVSLIDRQAHAKLIKVNVRTDLDGPDHVTADRRAIKQVLINLLSNAVKFTPEGGCINIDAWFEHDTLAFAVSDTGIGMDDDEQAGIFSAFNQVDNGTTRQVEGTGLGLCLVKGLIELHSGNIAVSSSKNVGTKMLVQIPHARQSYAVEQSTAKTQEPQGGTEHALQRSA
ncbi:MAG: HAMP domain-containing sensor histidine kinase [Pseudomonadota bacterium]